MDLDDPDMTRDSVFTTGIGWYERMETGVSLSEVMALKHCIEDTEHLRFKLRMVGILI